MNKFSFTLLLILFQLFFSCGQKKQNDDLKMLLLFVAANTNNSPCVNCTCNTVQFSTNAASSCMDYKSSDWTVSRAQNDCSQSFSGTTYTTSSYVQTFSTTGPCTTANSLGSCTLTYGSSYYAKGATTIQIYSDPNSYTAVTTSQAQSSCTGILSGTFTASTVSPSIRFKNNSGTTQSYGIYSNYLCSSLVLTIGSNVANGQATTYATVPAGTYYISYNNGTTCSTNSYTFSNGVDDNFWGDWLFFVYSVRRNRITG